MNCNTNKLLNNKVFLSFALPGVSYICISSNVKEVAIRYLNFRQCDFLSVMVYTVLHSLDS